MAGVLVLGGAVMTLVSVHLIALLQARGVALAAAVSYGALIGPAQVAARVVEMAAKGPGCVKTCCSGRVNPDLGRSG